MKRLAFPHMPCGWMLTLLCPVTLLWVAGCSSAHINPNITVYDRDTVADRPIALPGNYSTDNYRRMTIAVEPGSLHSNAFGNDSVEYMSLRMQSELAKLKRFSISALHGTNDTRLRELEDLGEISVVQPEALKAIDLLLGWNITINAEAQRDGRDSTIHFVCAINITCKDLRTGTVAFTKDLDFNVTREQQRNRYGHVTKGFDYSNDSQVKAFLQNIATQAAIRIANELGNEYPVGGRVTGALGTDLLTIDKGVEQGIAKGMQMVVYATIGGVDVPLGNAEATPGTNTSQLEMWRLNTENKYAAKILKQIEEQPNWFTHNRMYAVGYGMAMPPEWQTKELYLPSGDRP